MITLGKAGWGIYENYVYYLCNFFVTYAKIESLLKNSNERTHRRKRWVIWNLRHGDEIKVNNPETIFVTDFRPRTYILNAEYTCTDY